MFKLFSFVQNTKKLKKHERVFNDHHYCYVEMPNEGNKILKYDYGEKSLKVLAITYADLERLLEKLHSCQNNLEKSYTEKKQLSIQQKTNLIVTMMKIVWKVFVKT